MMQKEIEIEMTGFKWGTIDGQQLDGIGYPPSHELDVRMKRHMRMMED